MPKLKRNSITASKTRFDSRDKGTVDSPNIPKGTPIRNTRPKVGRNKPCICGSGKKLKDCCARKAKLEEAMTREFNWIKHLRGQAVLGVARAAEAVEESTQRFRLQFGVDPPE